MATVKVSNVSTKATEKDISDFFSFCGDVSSIETRKIDDSVQEAFVTFVEERALDTAVLLTGAVIVDKPVTVEAASDYVPPSKDDKRGSEEVAGSNEKKERPYGGAESIVSDLLAKGYILGKDALAKAKSFDDEHEISKNAAERVAAFRRSATVTVEALDQKYSLREKLAAGAASFSARATQVTESVQTLDSKYQITDKAKSAFSVAESKINEAGDYVMKSKYFQTGRAWFSNTLSRSGLASRASESQSQQGAPGNPEREGDSLVHKAPEDKQTNADASTPEKTENSSKLAEDKAVEAPASQKKEVETSDW
eukprot:TRINITY_DN1235_c0_g1_i4.p1 TRINITY_DN1235_c0_g1~~TRINITY_DN1235_c0_g1_i4.p1  ORF type:complete len:311 (+),score=55.24 TRINITY_DN1235_c0_g1_i4:126-1058(+)